MDPDARATTAGTIAGTTADATTAVDTTAIKDALARYCTGVAVVTALDPADGRPVGMAVQSFSSVSLDPPLVCFCPAHTSTTWPRVRAAGAFAVNVLAADQEDLCRRFAVTGGDKFAGTAWRPGGNGAPLVEGALATVECVLTDVLDGGDHAIALGRVTALTAHRPEAGPLLYFRRGYGRLPSAPSTPDPPASAPPASDPSTSAPSTPAPSTPEPSASGRRLRAASSSSMSASIASARSRSEA
ncbi:flavin reductase family protein [Streptomyces sp. NPDC051921]|uniref:flavin reductase family protein n=1 Tax=Streptomyces sp. NPDC051921 TaxID=3155806 RepID=UPI0034378ED0